MKFVPNRDFDVVTSALNFTTPDLTVLGGCDLYTTKAAGGDKKLYKHIENGLEEQHKSNVQFAHSLSPPQQTMMAETLNLSRSSPFGNLGVVGSRRTYAYLIATLNASHPDYDFSHMLRPRDFKRERSLRQVMNNLDTALYNLRPRPINSFLSVPNVHPASACPPTGQSSWGPAMWRLIDQQMSLKECAIYRYAPEDFDPFEDDEAGSLWSMNYFFFNKARKRVCYLYLRGVSILAGDGYDTPLRTPIKGKRSIDEESDDGWISPDLGARKRAKYWLGDRNEILGIADDDDDGDIPMQSASSYKTNETVSPPLRPVVDENDNYLLSDEETRDGRAESHNHVRSMSEDDIVGPIEV